MNGIEAKDLENEVDNEALIYRLHKVEKMIASDKVAANELHKTVEEATNMIDSLKTRVNNLVSILISFSFHQLNILISRNAKTTK